MEIVNDPTNRIKLEEGKHRRRQLLQLFYKYVKEDVVILPVYEYNRLIDDNRKLTTQLRLINEMRQAEADRRDVHRPV